MGTSNNKGFSLIEVVVVVAIIGILGAVGLPSLLSWLENKGVQNAGRDLYSNMRQAQSVAIKNNRNCAISFDGTAGYMVYVDNDKSFSYDAGEEIVAEVVWSQYRDVVYDNVNFADNGEATPKKTIAFQPTLLPADKDGGVANGTARIKNTSGSQVSVVVSVSGNISLQ